MGHLANSCVNTDLGFLSAAHQKKNNREAKLDITFKEVDKFSRQAETRADQLGPRQSTVALACATDLSEQKSEFNFI